MILLMTRAQLKDWQRIVYDEEGENEVLEEKADELGLKILKELASRYRSKASTSDPHLRWAWEDQLEVITSVINTISE